MARSKKVILFVVNSTEFFLSHRLPIAVAAKKMGFDVHIASSTGKGVKQITDSGFTFHHVSFSRSGQNVLRELQCFLCLTKLFIKLSPDLVHLITIKPVLYGSIVARLVGVKSVVCAISGLGTVFQNTNIFARIRRWIVCKLYKSAFKHPNLAVIFQNPDDKNLLLNVRALTAEQTRIIRGSGVSLSSYPYIKEPEGVPVVVMAARLLRDKGVFEYVEAARILKKRCVSIDIRLIGDIDLGNPTSINNDILNEWENENIINVYGFRSDIATQYSNANIVCLPSYREGLPKSLIEAAACGRAVITTDVPGCRDAIVAGETGILVPVKDPLALADAINWLIDTPEQRRKMGKAGRLLAENEFNIENVIDKHMTIYQELIRNV
ncbi:glycosyltransferase family 4 protein [Neptuniibacter sp. QD48_11]|uniref:glycosyltransferase family 4 protein n=1 Tax=Neptuniibacter sp. QD48_11 TaxID=3398211 RepID=UPI0039F46DC6